MAREWSALLRFIARMMFALPRYGASADWPITARLHVEEIPAAVVDPTGRHAELNGALADPQEQRDHGRDRADHNSLPLV